MNARQMPGFERFVLQTKAQIKRITASPIRWFGLQFSEVTVETVPWFFQMYVIWKFMNDWNRWMKQKLQQLIKEYKKTY